MIYIFSWIFIIGAGFIIYKSIRHSVNEEKQNSEVLQRQAKKRNGTIQKNYAGLPILEFSDNGTQIQLASPAPEAAWSFIQCSIQNCKTFTCIIVPRSVFSKVFTTPEIHIDDPILSDRFAIYSNDKDMAENFLDEDVRNACANLDVWERLEIKKGSFELKIKGRIIDDQSADLFIESGLVMIRRLTELHKNID